MGGWLQWWWWEEIQSHVVILLQNNGAPQLCAILLVTLIVVLYALLYTATFFPRGSSEGSSSSEGSGGSSLWGKRGICSSKKTRALVAIAHPDDEVMFFGPTILNLLRDGHEVYLLCFSYGDSEGLGLKRKAELWKSTAALGILDENVTIIKHDQLKDGMSNKWPILPISAHIKSFLYAYDINMLITFDDKGVSGHSNHISVHNAAQDLIDRNLLPSGCQVYFLKSVGFLRQYVLNLFNIPLSYYFNPFVLVSIGGDYKKIVKAMKCHSTQMLWFRHLHLYFSMYLFVNIFLNVSPRPRSSSPPSTITSTTSNNPLVDHHRRRKVH